MTNAKTYPSQRPAVSILMMAYTNYEIDPRVIRAAEAAAEAGFAVDCLVLRRPGQSAEEIINGVRVIRLAQERYRSRSRAGYLWAYSLFFVRCLVASARLCTSKHYRVVHVHNMPDVLVFSALIPRLFGAKVILDIHDPMPETLMAKYAGSPGGTLYRLLVRLEKMSVAFASRTVTVNHPVRDHVLLAHGYRPDQIGVIANFADDRLFTPIPYTPPVDKVRCVFHGTILERYGLRTLVEAVAAMKHQDRIEVRIIGEGDFSQQLHALIESKRLSRVVRFDNRAYPLCEIPQRLADCHVGLVPLDVTPVSDFALPLKLIEYTCLGLPSITVRSTAIAYYLQSDECLMYAPGDAAALTNILDAVAESPASLGPVRERLPAARARLSWTLEKERYIAMLRELIDGQFLMGDMARYGEPRS